MPNQLSSNTLFGQGWGGFNNLSPVKGNCPFEYYTNDTEFVSDARNVAGFVAQRLGVGGIGAAQVYITDLTVYATFEEAVTTYGNMVYQYKVRDNYINLEGADTLPFVNIASTLVSTEDVNVDIYWSDKRLATWGEIGFDIAYSASVANGETYVISASIDDFVAPDFKYIKNFTFPHLDLPNFGPVNLSRVVHNQFNKVGGKTIATTNYFSSFTTFDTIDLSIFTPTPGSSSFSVTGSNGNKALFVVTASIVPDDLIDVFYITTGSDANETANNIANKFNSVSSNFGLIVTANTGSTPVQLNLTSSIGTINPIGSGFEINWLDNSNNPIQVVFTNPPGDYLTYQIPTGSNFIYFFTNDPSIHGKNTSYFPDGYIPTIYNQDNLRKHELNNSLIRNNLQSQINIANEYALEAGLNGNVTEYTGSIELRPYQQVYDLNAWAAASASLEEGDSIEIRQVFYQEPPAIVRYFDPYAGTGTGVQGLLETFGFGSYSPGINFMLMPVYWDIQKIQAIEFNDQVRKSAFSFELVNNQLRIFPVPTDTSPKVLLFKYFKKSNKYSPFVDDKKTNVISDVMNVPYRNPIYSNINQIGRSWIFRYTLALCKEIEGQIRATFQGTNFSGIVINGAELLTDARNEKTDLLTELKEYLDQTTRRSQLERKQQEADFLRQSMNQIPLPIYVL